MKKIDPFFITVLLILFCLSTSFFAFDYHLSGLSFEKQKVQILENQVVQLKLKNEALTLQAANFSNRRDIASVQGAKQISFDQIYRAQLQQAIKVSNSEALTFIINKIINNSTDADLLAEAYYQKSVVTCHGNFKEQSCLQDIETVVSQFPESKWAAESLALLSGIYLKLKRYKEAESVMNLVKVEFAKEKDVLQKISRLEKSTQ